MKSKLTHLLAISLLTSGIVAAKSALAQSTGSTVIEWPLEISGPQGTAVVYQPQPESFKDDQITARVAVSTQLNGEKAPVFGAAWITARVSIDRDARTVEVVTEGAGVKGSLGSNEG